MFAIFQFLFLFHDTQSILGCYGLFNGRGRIYSGARTREHLALLPFSLHGPFDESWKMSVCRQRLLAHQLSKLFIFCFFLFFLEIQTFCRTLNQNNLFFPIYRLKLFTFSPLRLNSIFCLALWYRYPHPPLIDLVQEKTINDGIKLLPALRERRYWLIFMWSCNLYQGFPSIFSSPILLRSWWVFFCVFVSFFWWAWKTKQKQQQEKVALPFCHSCM